MTLDTAEHDPLARAKELVDAGQYELAVQQLREHLVGSPGDARAWHRLAGALIGAQLLDEALSAAQRSVEIEPGDAVAHRFVGLAHYDRGEFTEAAVAAQVSIGIDPAGQQAWLLVALCHLQLPSDLAASARAAEQVIALDADTAEAAGAGDILQMLSKFRQNRLAMTVLACLPIPAFVLLILGLLAGPGEAGGVSLIILGVAGLAAAAFLPRILRRRGGWTAATIRQSALAAVVTSAVVTTAAALAGIPLATAGAVGALALASSAASLAGVHLRGRPNT